MGRRERATKRERALQITRSCSSFRYPGDTASAPASPAAAASLVLIEHRVSRDRKNRTLADEAHPSNHFG